MYSLLAVLCPFIYLALILLKSFVSRSRAKEVEAYPPTGDSALLIERIRGKKITQRGIVAAIVELAKDGYIRLQKVGEDYDALLIEEYKGFDRRKSELIECMFSDRNEVSGLEDSIIAYPVCHLTKDGNLKNRINQFVKELNEEEILDRKVFIPTGNKKEWLISSTLLIVVVTILCKANIPNTFIQPIILAPFIYTGLQSITEGIEKRDIMKLVFGAMWALVVGTAYSSLVNSGFGSPALFLSLCAIAISYVVTMLKRVSASYQIERKVLSGFLKLLNGGKKYKEMSRGFSQSNPDRFYEVLPYVCALGKQDEWIKQHKDIKVEQPEWIVSNDDENDQDLIQNCVDKLIESVK